MYGQGQGGMKEGGRQLGRKTWASGLFQMFDPDGCGFSDRRTDTAINKNKQQHGDNSRQGRKGDRDDQAEGRAWSRLCQGAWRGVRTAVHEGAEAFEESMSLVSNTTSEKVVFRQPTNRFLGKMSNFPSEFTMLQNNQRPTV